MGKIKDWWRGNYVVHSLEEVLGEAPEQERFIRPWPARVWLVLKGFYLKEWKWIWTIAISATSLYLAFLTLKVPK